jgi:hypothetical protein
MGLSYATHYFTQAMQASHKTIPQPPYLERGSTTKWWKLARYSAHILAIAAGIGSLVLFLFGMWDVRSAITAFK